MVKHTQTIRGQIADKLFECVWPYCGVDVQMVKIWFFQLLSNSKWPSYDIQKNRKNLLLEKIYWI